jgi:hypothetical protein
LKDLRAMPLHLIKLCVGADSIDDLATWQAERRKRSKGPFGHTTFQTPKRQGEVLNGGSLYWVIKGVVQVRQPITGFGDGKKEDGSPCCLIELGPDLIPVLPMPRRPFQGWRYLTAEDAPADIGTGRRNKDLAEMPPALRRELASLGLL